MNTLEYVKQSLEKYQQLIEGISIIFSYLIKADMTTEQQKKVMDLYSLYDLYRQETQALTQQVSQLELYQQNLQKVQSQPTAALPEEKPVNHTFSAIGKLIVGLMVLGLIILFAQRKKASSV